MVSRRRAMRLLGTIALLICMTAATAAARPPKLIGAVSRMRHGLAGTFDVTLPVGRTAGISGSGIECRNVANGMMLVLKFDQPVVSGSAKVTRGTATIAGAPQFQGNRMIVLLGGVANAQAVVVTVSNVANSAKEKLASADVPFRVLVGDVNADGKVNATDANLCRNAAAKKKPVSGSSYRSDITLNGIISGADLSMISAVIVQAQAQPLDGGSASNSPPTISQVPDQTGITGVPTTPAGFTVADSDTDLANVTVESASSDTSIVPLANIQVTGTGASRTVQITPVAGLTSVVTVTITLTAYDGIDHSTPMSFLLTITPPPTTYLATLSPIPGVTSLGTGSATLTVAGDRNSAILRYSYSNLAGADTDDAVYAPGDVVLYDVPVAKAQGNQQPDGSFKWNFPAANRDNILAAIEGNNAYMILESAAYPAGELKGIFKKVNGSQTFVPPPDPPQITISPPTKYDASRFLQQAAFGGMGSEIAALSDAQAGNSSTALEDWLEAQFNTPGPIYPSYAASAITPTVSPLGPQSSGQPYTESSMYRNVYLRVTRPQSGPGSPGDTLDVYKIHEAWWRNAVTMPDQLRQRVATALSEILVVSQNEGTIGENSPGLASWYDMLADDAFVNFRQLLGDVTLHPIMGEYLNMRGNKKAVPPASPNENYAREIMQLFTIGLYMLQPDGTLMLDANGQPIPTYDQTTITNFAQVFTGWDADPSKVTIPTLIAATPPATGTVVANFSSSYQKPMAITPANHSTVQKNLLVYPGCPTFPGASVPGVIPARSQQTSMTATAELNYALDNIFYHPNVGPFICRQLIMRLVGSNPSPAYVYRVAKVFADDGSADHVRGNMKAVITAILTDYEARSPQLLAEPGYGRCREPVIRMANLMRSCGAISKSGKWRIGQTDDTLQQTILRSPTVFNFFDPHYAEPGAVSDAGIVSPELEIIHATTITLGQNMIYTGVYATYNSAGFPTGGTGFLGDSGTSGVSGDVVLDLSTSGSGLVNVAQTQGTSAMIDQTALLLMGAPLSGSMRRTVQTFITTKIGATAYVEQVKAAVHLIATSAQAAAAK